MLDSSIPLMAKGIDGLKMLEDGSQIAQLWQNQKTDSELNRLYKETNGDLNKMMEIGKTSPMARFVMPQLQAQQAAQQKAALDQQKIEADIGKTQSEIGKIESETGKIGAETSETNQKIASAKLLQAKQAVFAGAASGNPEIIKNGLDAARAAGALDEQTYTQFIQQLDSLGKDPVKISEWAKGAVLAGSQNPASFLFQTKDNEADNAQSDKNSQRTYKASTYKTDKQFQSDQDKLEFAKGKISPLYTEGQAALKNGAKLETISGVTYIDLGGGKGIPYVDQDGKPLSATGKANGVPKLSDNALKQVNEASTQLSQARQSYIKIGGLVNDLKGGKLDLSASNIAAAKARMAIGQSTPNDLAIDRFQAALNQAANDVLMMAKGTQTEGDAQRAVATITANPPRDNNAAMQALNTLAGIQRNTINTLNGNINTIYDNYGIARPGINKPSQNGGGSPANNTGGRSSLSSILFE